MKKSILLPILFLIICTATISHASDTTWVKSHDQVHLNWYGNFYKKAKFPSADSSYKSIVLKFTIGCPTRGCSDWDYTTKVFARRKIGVDTVIVQKPRYKLGNVVFDSLYYSTTPIYQTFFNAVSSSTDSSLVPSQKLYSFLDSAHSSTATDSVVVYKAGFKNYTFNASGQITDSIWVAGNQFLRQSYWSIPQYNDKYEHIEFARYITPYSGDKVFGFYREFYSDITDFRSVLTDSVEIGVKYEGYSDGFTVSLDYYFIKGEPLREAYKVVPIYYGGFEYGNPNNSIENYLKEVTLPVDTNCDEMGIHILQTGHGFGGNEDCAEFCPKYNFVLINGVQRYSNLVWKNTCGLNPLYPQPGTWLYDRANWCPGEMVRPFYHDLSAWMVPGQDIRVNLNMTPFTNVGNNSCSYNVAANVIYYRDRKSEHDLQLTDVIAPSKKWQHARFNPICSNPIIEVYNNSKQPVNGIKIRYGIIRALPLQEYTWNETLAPFAKARIELPPVDFAAGNDFEVELFYIENKIDFDPLNNKTVNAVVQTPVLPTKFAIEFRSNSFPQENFYEIFDWTGTQVHYRENFKVNTMHKDTVELAPGCYTFVFTDTDKDGLAFFANSDGTGSLRLRDMGGNLFKTFQANFGTEHRYQFTTSSTVGLQDEHAESNELQLYPNPAQSELSLSLPANQSFDAYSIYNMQGQLLAEKQDLGSNGSLKIILPALVSGMYLIEIESDGQIIRKKFEIAH